jgi:hypothetical protein
MGCHGITSVNGFPRFGVVEDLTIPGDNGGDYNKNNPAKNGIIWANNKKSYRCVVRRVQVIHMAGEGVYASYDFFNIYDEVYVTHFGGYGIEISGLNTCTSGSCFVDFVAPGRRHTAYTKTPR